MDTTTKRKIRKGTSSCWECKRRKVRCVFRVTSDAVCIGCRRRGSSCVSQEFSDQELPENRVSHQGDRIANLEAVVQDLVKSVTAGSMTATPCNFPSNHQTRQNQTDSQSSPHRVQSLLHLNNPGVHQPNKYIQLSRTLFEALPPQEDIELIWRAGNRTSVHLVHHFQMSPEDNERASVEELQHKLLRRPGPNAHPVLIARYMLLLAKFMQYLSPQCFETLNELSLPPRALMQRLAHTANSLAIDNEELLGTIEGLECVIIEGTFQANIGNIRRAWLAFRRALSIAQLMGIHRANDSSPLNCVDSSSARVNCQTMWFRIVYVDRFLSLMLGLPTGSLDRGLASKANLAKETPLGQLSRVHCAVAAQISERNDGDSTDYEITQKIDEQLQKAANSLPGKWWLTPNLAGTDEKSVFQETLRIVEQIYHYNLLNQLYLPSMLEFNHGSADTDARDRHSYAKHTCVNSSREVLSRFNALRSFSGIAFCCRSIDFLGLMAAITLLLAHLSSHRLGSSRKFATNLMVHQRLSDRAVIGCMLEYMADTHHWDTDLLTKKSIDWVRHLLEAEAGAANGDIYTLDRMVVSGDRSQISDDEEHTILISIAYFGLIKVTREDSIRVENPRTHTQQLCDRLQDSIEDRWTRSQNASTSSYTPPIHPHSSLYAAQLENGGPLVMPNTTPAGLSPRTGIEGLNQDLPEFPVFDGDGLQLPYVLTNNATHFEDCPFPNGDRVSFGNLINGLGLDLNGDASL
ncbi:hypothetical protein GGR51DRAFT_576176 [Nemania sp. FL0031]|nr:hypothetical protein GGR51DRAFT_576176 [Nemania sp. FL0031]